MKIPTLLTAAILALCATPARAQVVWSNTCPPGNVVQCVPVPTVPTATPKPTATATKAPTAVPPTATPKPPATSTPVPPVATATPVTLPTATGGLPTRLLRQSDLVHQGSFTIPGMREPNQGQYCEYTQGVIAFNPANKSLFLVCHDWTQTVAEITIPSSLSGQATVLQTPRDALEGRMNQISPPGNTGSKKIGGMHVVGGQLLLAAYVYYDGDGSAVASHFVRSTNLSSASVQGPFRVGTMNPAFYAGYFSSVPAAWRSSLGGDLLNGQCCLSIISRTSYGPSVSAVSTVDLLAARPSSPATMLTGYPSTHPTLGAWDASWNPPSVFFNGTTVMRGVVLPENTATVLFFGSQGMGPFCYGTGADCNDPDGSSKGTHAYPYEPHVWAYNANDLAAVKSGSKQPWDLKPYATWKLADNMKANVGGADYDPATGRIFVTENYGDGTKPRIHVFTIGAATP